MKYDTRIPEDESEEIVASQIAALRYLPHFKSGRTRIQNAAKRENWSDSTLEAELVLAELRFLPAGGATRAAEVEETILQAARKRDAQFFLRLSEIFQESQKSVWQKTSTLERFLIMNWVETLGPWPALCLLTNEDLTTIFIQEFYDEPDDESLTADCVQKTRQRLGLKPSKHKLKPDWGGGRIKGFK